MKVKFFASLRELVGIEELELDASSLTTLRDLVTHLRQTHEGCAALFADRMVLMAVNQEVVGLDAEISDADEIAFFPPVTGG